MRPRTRSAGAAGIGAERVRRPHRSIEPSSIVDALACASLTGSRSASTGGSGSMPNSFTLPPDSTMWICSVFFEWWWRRVIGRDQRAGDTRPAPRRCGAAGEGFNSPECTERRRNRCRRRYRCSRRPCRRDPAKVASYCASSLPCADAGPAAKSSASTTAGRPARATQAAPRGAGAKCSSCHLGAVLCNGLKTIIYARNTGETTARRRDGRYAQRRNLIKGQCERFRRRIRRLYDAKKPPSPQTGFSRQNLDAPRLSPYTSPLLDGHDFEPRSGPHQRPKDRDAEIYEDGAALRIDGQGADGGSQVSHSNIRPSAGSCRTCATSPSSRTRSAAMCACASPPTPSDVDHNGGLDAFLLRPSPTCCRSARSPEEGDREEEGRRAAATAEAKAS